MSKFINKLFSKKAQTTKRTTKPVKKSIDKVETTMWIAGPIVLDKSLWTTHNVELSENIAALNRTSRLLDRHFLFLSIVDETYKRRSEPKMVELCAQVSETHLAEFPEIRPALKRDIGFLPRVPTYQQYAIILTELEEYEKAIAVCREAIRHGLKDGTKSGFEGRITRIRKVEAASGSKLNQ